MGYCSGVKFWVQLQDLCTRERSSRYSKAVILLFVLCCFLPQLECIQWVLCCFLPQLECIQWVLCSFLPQLECIQWASEYQ